MISIDPPSSTVQQGQDASFKCLIHGRGQPPSALSGRLGTRSWKGEPDRVQGVLKMGMNARRPPLEAGRRGP